MSGPQQHNWNPHENFTIFHIIYLFLKVFSSWFCPKKNFCSNKHERERTIFWKQQWITNCGSNIFSRVGDEANKEATFSHSRVTDQQDLEGKIIATALTRRRTHSMHSLNDDDDDDNETKCFSKKCFYFYYMYLSEWKVQWKEPMLCKWRERETTKWGERKERKGTL